MKIALIISETPPVLSGMARVAEALGSGFEAAGHTVETYSTAQTGRLSLNEMRLTGLLLHWPELRRRIRAADVVSLHGPVPTFSDAFLFLMLLRVVPHRPKLVYTHHFDIRFRWAGPIWTAYNSSQHRLARVADRVIVTTKGLARPLASAVGPERVGVIPWGSDGYGPVEPAKPEAFTVLYVGQLRAVKGVDNLILAAAQVPDARVIIVGEGGEGARLRRLAADCAATNVEFFGPAHDADLRSLYGAAHVVVLPSVRMESFGIVLLEGMAAGCVAVASALSGPAEVIGDAGVLYPPGDVEALVRILQSLRERSARQPLVERGRERSRTFTWQRTVDSYLATFESVLQTKGGALGDSGAEIASL